MSEDHNHSQTPSGASLAGQVALITGAAARIGAEIARTLHQEGCDLILHYRHSAQAAAALQAELEHARADSIQLLQCDLNAADGIALLEQAAHSFRQRLDILVNNASSFYPQPLAQVTPADWDDLLGSNLRAPFFLTQALAPLLSAGRGSVVNLVDIHAERPLKNYPVYSIAKAGNAMMVKALARELGPAVRVNGIAPGAILWPEQGMDETTKANILERTALERPGGPQDIARTLLFLVRDAPYITGQILAVDGGRTLQQ
ncbi:pteridine reductase [Rhabdochromatium marinum]|uniref:pteridine reductase n=1 Tax=Rhabdochromatium marinum TaxID=48729 RepID=UPI001903D520|nr:pteridine reductase [Rhabdochromatium marinum]MBK1647975.1 pteridine reductase [Rhabdochromatium marinum]